MGGLRLQGFATPQLQPFDLQLAGGECISLNGPSGSGKTRLLRAIADLDPHRGEAWVDGLSQHQLSAPEWRRRVALLPAESHWWEDRVGTHFQQLSEAMLKAVGLPPEAADWEVARLSSGERQRLALVRLLENRPQVLLLDEPTANLDPKNTARIEGLIGEWQTRQGCALVWTSHDQAQLLRVASRHLRIRAGRVEEVAPWN